jgi:hypothetical protein
VKNCDLHRNFFLFGEIEIITHSGLYNN